MLVFLHQIDIHYNQLQPNGRPLNLPIHFQLQKKHFLAGIIFFYSGKIWVKEGFLQAAVNVEQPESLTCKLC